MSTNWETADVLKTPMEVCWQFDYEISIDKLQNLYSKAKRTQWDAEVDIDWERAIDPSKPIVDEGQFAFDRIPFLQRLDDKTRESFRAHMAAHLLSQFLHGEQGALMTAAALTHAVPDYEGKLYAATQTMDEARHVEVYQRYIDRLAVVYPISPWLKDVIDVTLQAEIPADRAAAADNRQPARLRVDARFVFADVHEWSNHHMLAVIRYEPRRHRLQVASEEYIEQQRLDEIVGVVPQGNFGRSHLARKAVQHAAAESGTERAWCRARIQYIVQDLANRRMLDAVFPSPLLTRACDHIVLVLSVAGIYVHRNQREPDRRSLPQHIEQLHERPAILATR